MISVRVGQHKLRPLREICFKPETLDLVLEPSDGAPSRVISIPWGHLYAARPDEDGLSLRLHHVEVLRHDPFPIASRRCSELRAEEGSELAAVAERIDARVGGNKTALRPRYLVIINPFGGERRARHVYDTIVQPMLAEAQIEHDLSPTQYRTHAKLLAHSVKKDLYQGLLVVGGDGLLHECINGLLSRRDWATTPDFYLGIIPAGTSNAIARSLGISDPVWATLAVLKRSTCRMDALLFEQDNRRFYGHFACMWGLFADIDLGSESWRCLGRNRLYCSTITQLLRLRRYRAKISFIPVLADASSAADAPALPIPPAGNTISGPERPALRYRRYFERAGGEQPQDPHYPVECWEEEEFYSFLALKHPWLDRDVCICPEMTAAPDVIELFALPCREGGVTRSHFFQAMLNSDGATIHGDPRLCLHVRVRACRISFCKRIEEEPLLDIDGEEVPRADIYFESLPNILTVFCSP